MQTPYSQLGEAPSKREWHDTHRTWSSYEAWERPGAGAPPTQSNCHHGRGSALPGAKGGGQMVNWKQGLRRSWIVASGCWVVGLPLYVYRPGQPPRRLLEDYGDYVVLFWMVAGPILLLLVGRLVVWAEPGARTQHPGSAQLVGALPAAPDARRRRLFQSGLAALVRRRGRAAEAFA